MKTFKTMSDAGGIAVGTAKAWTIISNGYGDGETTVYICETKEEFDELCKQHNYDLRFLTTVTGTEIQILDYDCPNSIPWFRDGSLHNFDNEESVCAVLNGCFGCYHESTLPIVVLKKWS